MEKPSQKPSTNRVILLSIVAPILIVATLQSSGCIRKPPPPAPEPGGTYLSESAGANFDQSVDLASGEGNISQFNLQRSTRPAHAPSEIYIAANDKGYVVSKDDGRSWTQVSTPLTSTRDIVALADGTIVVAGVNDIGQGFILRSLDEGKSWETVLTIPVPQGKTGFRFPGTPSNDQTASVVISIEGDPFIPDRIYAGSSLGDILIGEQAGKTWRTITLLDNPRSSSGGGNPDSKLAVVDIYPSPHTQGEILVRTVTQVLWRLKENQDDISQVSQEAILVRKDLNSTSRFFSPNALRQIKSVAYSPTEPDLLLVGDGSGAIISNDAGRTWKELPIPVSATQQFDTVAASFSPTNAERILVGINNVIYRSEDNGRNWNTFRIPATNHLINALLINPTNAANVLAVTTPIRS